MAPTPDDELKLFSFPRKSESNVRDYLKVEAEPGSFSAGPHSLRGEEVVALNGDSVALVYPRTEAPANGHLLASAWELYTMLSEYLATDHCTDHDEGETCRFCVSMDVIRRALGTPDEAYPVQTWFGMYREQRAIREAYQKRYERFRAKVSEIALHAEDRIFRLQAQITTLEKQYPERAAALAKGLGELMLVQTLLER